MLDFYRRMSVTIITVGINVDEYNNARPTSLEYRSCIVPALRNASGTIRQSIITDHRIVSSGRAITNICKCGISGIHRTRVCNLLLASPNDY